MICHDANDKDDDDDVNGGDEGVASCDKVTTRGSATQPVIPTLLRWQIA